MLELPPLLQPPDDLPPAYAGAAKASAEARPVRMMALRVIVRVIVRTPMKWLTPINAIGVPIAEYRASQWLIRFGTGAMCHGYRHQIWLIC